MAHFDPKKFASAIKYYVPDDIKLKKKSAELLQSIVCEISTNFIKAVKNKAEKLQVIDAKIVQESIEPLLPKDLKRYAFANASRNVCLYSSGVLSHEEQLNGDEPVAVDFRKGVKRIFQDFNATPARGFLPHINGYLNDLCHALAEKSSENAKMRNGVLAENDVFYAIDEMLPHDLRVHAYARISFLQAKSILPPTQTTKEPESPVVENLVAEDQDESTELMLQPVHDKRFSISDLICPVSYEGEEEERENETERMLQPVHDKRFSISDLICPVSYEGENEGRENEAMETDQVEEESSTTYLDLEKEMYTSVGGNESTEEQAEDMNVDRPISEQPRKSFLETTLEWFSPSKPTNQEKEVEQEESET